MANATLDLDEKPMAEACLPYIPETNQTSDCEIQLFNGPIGYGQCIAKFSGIYRKFWIIPAGGVFANGKTIVKPFFKTVVLTRFGSIKLTLKREDGPVEYPELLISATDNEINVSEGPNPQSIQFIIFAVK